MLSSNKKTKTTHREKFMHIVYPPRDLYLRSRRNSYNLIMKRQIKWAKDVHRRFSKEDIDVVSKQVKRGTSLVNKEL